ncbi:MAG: hypothetical protein JOY76_10775 [Hyphomicrobiales bacterium]|nr:hypothetical protein [Hyphomicrobiales bacterium]
MAVYLQARDDFALALDVARALLDCGLRLREVPLDHGAIFSHFAHSSAKLPRQKPTRKTKGKCAEEIFVALEQASTPSSQAIERQTRFR